MPKSRIRKWANDAGLPNHSVLTTAERAETSISDENDAADDNSESDSNTLNSSKSYLRFNQSPLIDKMMLSA